MRCSRPTANCWAKLRGDNLEKAIFILRDWNWHRGGCLFWTGRTGRKCLLPRGVLAYRFCKKPSCFEN